MAENIIARGAEAVLIRADGNLVKRRIKKSYRLEEIDEKLRKSRTRQEAKLIEKLQGKIFVPKILKTEEKNKEIIMEFIDGKKLSENLDSFSLEEQKEICFKIGEEVSKIHQEGIIHGDLTTSNMIFKEKEGQVYFIDFGLGFGNGRIEDKAVDLHLLKQALEARHFKNWQELFHEVLRGYKKYAESEKVLKQLEKVEKRGRYKGS